jgi:pSer/pThr/pTyr-binding forkhead associated (FHA) protein
MALGFLRGGGTSFALNNPATTIGRDPSCDICLQSRSVSTRHAIIEIGSDGPLLRDLNSKNGTIVNETRVQNATIPLVHGDVIRFGYGLCFFQTVATIIMT